jgi:putative hydrolase of the HAD superfamily
MAIKAIMVDVDGVLLVHPDPQGWGVNLERDLGLAASTLQSAFFERHWDDIVHGRASLRVRLAPVLKDIAPHLSCEEVIAYWFENDAHIDQRLVGQLASYRSTGVEIHLATVQDHERAGYIWNVLGFASMFDRMHYAAEMGFSKPDPGFYRCIEMRSGFRPEELFFIDDKPANVAAAQACGWAAALWTGRTTLESLVPAPF